MGAKTRPRGRKKQTSISLQPIVMGESLRSTRNPRTQTRRETKREEQYHFHEKGGWKRMTGRITGATSLSKEIHSPKKGAMQKNEGVKEFESYKDVKQHFKKPRA